MNKLTITTSDGDELPVSEELAFSFDTIKKSTQFLEGKNKIYTVEMDTITFTLFSELIEMNPNQVYDFFKNRKLDLSDVLTLDKWADRYQWTKWKEIVDTGLITKFIYQSKHGARYTQTLFDQLEIKGPDYVIISGMFSAQRYNRRVGRTDLWKKAILVYDIDIAHLPLDHYDNYGELCEGNVYALKNPTGPLKDLSVLYKEKEKKITIRPDLNLPSKFADPNQYHSIIELMPKYGGILFERMSFSEARELMGSLYCVRDRDPFSYSGDPDYETYNGSVQYLSFETKLKATRNGKVVYILSYKYPNF